MRVYEFSKKHGLSSKELLELLSKNGFQLQSHMAVLTPEALSFLEKHYAPKPESRAESIQGTHTEAHIKNEEKIPESSQTRPEKQRMPLENSSKKHQSQEVTSPRPVVPSPRTLSEHSQPAIEKIILQPTTVGDLALAIHKPVSELILVLLKWGILSNKNQVLPIEVVQRVADLLGIAVEKPVVKKEEIKRAAALTSDQGVERLPVVVVVGHVDHGKTTLLDFIRKTRVASREKGGITQHLGAYEAQTPQGNIIFLDTPGHEAFSRMRARGIKVADIAILVVAADDGVMPQTVEALKRIKEIGLPIIVAVNKIDRVEPSRIDVVKRELSQYDLLPEEWGGSVIYAPLSAKLGTGVDHLLEMIVLQSQLMELRADDTGPAAGYILESRLEKGRGVVATLLLQQGTLSIGDYFSCGSTQGRVSALVDSHGKRLNKVGPSIPVQVSGFEELPEAGDFLEALTKNQLRKGRESSEVVDRSRMPGLAQKVFTEGGKNLIIKTDTNSSKEALLESLAKLSTKMGKAFNVIHASVGGVSESDVDLASSTGSEIYTLHVKAEPNAQLLAQRLGVTIVVHDIIYKLLEQLEQAVASKKEIKMVRKKTGEAVVRKVFDIKNLGVIAGCYMREGVISREGTVIVWRGRQKVGEGKIVSLQRDKKTVKEVHAGFECGIMVEDLTDWQPDDRVECFTMAPSEK